MVKIASKRTGLVRTSTRKTDSFGSIPHELKQQRSWGVWKREERDGKPTKVPYSARHGRKASSTNPDDWTTFEQARQAFERGGYDGLGFVFSESNDIVGIDLDKVIDAEGSLCSKAQEIVKRFASYTEVSPSGTGLHIFVKVRGDYKGHKGCIDGVITEMYTKARYFTITGLHWSDTPKAVEDRTAEFDTLYKELDEGRVVAGSLESTGGDFPSRDVDPLPDERVLEKARNAKNGDKFKRLYDDGNSSGYGEDDSRADLALCGMLAFYCGENGHEQVERLMHESALYREKYDEKRGEATYLRGTICKAYASKFAFSNTNGIQEHLPTIQTADRQLPETVDETLKALVAANDPPVVYVYGGKLTRIQFDRATHTTTARLQTLSKDALLHSLSRAANFVSLSKKGRRNVNPPDMYARMILAQPEWPQIPSLAGIVNTPIFAKDGTLCDAPGYNAAANIYLHLREELKLPDTTPTKENVRLARTRVENLLVDFPFANEASKAHAIAFLLLPFVREMIEGPTPLHMFSAPRAGTGKSLLMSALASVSVRYGVALQTAPKDEEEWRKRLTTQFREGHSHLLLDNITTLACENLQAALTAPDCLWRDRILGVSESVSLPIRCTWGATANNMNGTVEQLRRCVEIRLDAKSERPEERSHFKHPDLPQYLRIHYANIVAACLTIVRAWIEIGMPTYSGANPPMGSFESWTRVMGGILETASIRGFLDNRTEFVAQGDTEGHSIEEFANEWFSKHGVNEIAAVEVLPIALRYFETELGDGGEKSQAIRLGKMLSRYRDWVLNGRVLILKPTKNGARYALKPQR